MAIDQQAFLRLKKRAEKAGADKHKAEGALSATMEKLRTEFDCGTLEEAEDLLVKKNKDAAKAESTYDKAVVKFEKEWERYAKGEY